MSTQPTSGPSLWRREPARVVAVVVAVLALASSLGLHLTDAQSSSIVGVVTAVLALLGGEVVRSQVTPTDTTTDDAPAAPAQDPADYQPRHGTTTAEDAPASDAPTGTGSVVTPTLHPDDVEQPADASPDADPADVTPVTSALAEDGAPDAYAREYDPAQADVDNGDAALEATAAEATPDTEDAPPTGSTVVTS